MSKTYPIAEIFTSPQGEGLYAGTLMTFVRLAGCTVGRRYPKEMYELKDTPTFVGIEKFAQLPIYTHECTLYDGRKFACDTDYMVKEKLTAEEIRRRVPIGVRRVCLTGGEPLMHSEVFDLISECTHNGLKVHLETSGTIEFEGRDHVWVAVSPKENVLQTMIRRANEIKLLIDDSFDPQQLDPFVFSHALVFIQPVNYEHTINTDNMKLCLELQKIYPTWRISSQSHKLWNVR